MDAFFLMIESSAPSIWLRESPSLLAFPLTLIFHTLGLAFLVGTCVAVCGRVLGLASAVPLSSLERYEMVMWLGFWVNAISGVALLVAYPTKALTNPYFYVKLALIAAALISVAPVWRCVRREVIQPGTAVPLRVRVAAGATLVCWAGSITVGRFLAYTYTRLTVEFP